LENKPGLDQNFAYFDENNDDYAQRNHPKTKMDDPIRNNGVGFYFCPVKCGALYQGRSSDEVLCHGESFSEGS